jgi:hypothetical protein
MTCRCRSPQEHAQRAADNLTYSAAAAKREYSTRLRELERRTPNPDAFTVEDVEQVGRHLVLKVRYPGCEGCDFDRCKVMVYLKAEVKDVLRWRRIDPHFKAPLSTPHAVIREAPSPAARFPASADGWADALEYAKRKDEAL